MKSKSRNRWLTYGWEVRDGDFRKDIWVSILLIHLPKYRYYIDTYFLRYFPSLYYTPLSVLYKFLRLVFRRNTSIWMYTCCLKCAIWPDCTDFFMFSFSDMVTLHKPHDYYISKSLQNYKEYDTHVFSDCSHRLCFVICHGPLLLGQQTLLLHSLGWKVISQLGELIYLESGLPFLSQQKL